MQVEVEIIREKPGIERNLKSLIPQEMQDCLFISKELWGSLKFGLTVRK